MIPLFRFHFIILNAKIAEKEYDAFGVRIKLNATQGDIHGFYNQYFFVLFSAIDADLVLLAVKAGKQDRDR